MKINLLKIIVIFLIVAILAVFAVVVLPWLALAVGSVLFIPNPPVPQITYEEFPFRLEYEIDGEKIVVEDVLICQYKGIITGSNGKRLDWIEYLASDKKENAVLLITDGTRKVYCYVGDAEYYMDDEKYPEQRPLTPRIYMVKMDNMDFAIFTPEQLIEKYNIKIINWEFSEPIENIFK